MLSRKVLEGIYRITTSRGRYSLAVLPFIAIGGAAAAADNKLTPQQEKIVHEGTDKNKGQYVAKTDLEKPSTLKQRENDLPRTQDTHHWSISKYLDKEFWSHPLDESSAMLGTYVRKANLDLQKQPLRAEHQFSTVLAGEDLEDKGPEDSLLKRVTHKVGEYLPHTTTHDTRKDYGYSQTEMKEKASELKDKGAEKLGEMKDKAADTAYSMKEKTKEMATDLKDKMSDYAMSAKDKMPSSQEIKEKTQDKATDLGTTVKNKVSESISTLTDTVKSVVGRSESNEANVPGDDERWKTKVGEEAANLLQSHKPVNAFKTHTATVRVFADEPKRQLLTHKYTAHLNEDVMQTLIMDSDKPDARLIGIEYCITDKIYKQLPEEEKKLWYSHAFETKSGLEVAPRLPGNIEAKLMQDMAPTYGKAISLWHVDKNLLPVGFPKLLAPPASEQMINSSIWEQREKIFGPVAKEKQLRIPMQIAVPTEEWDKKGAIFTPEYKKL